MNWQTKAQKLFGDHWKATLGELFGCSKRAVQYWASGQRKTPPELIKLVDKTYKIWRE